MQAKTYKALGILLCYPDKSWVDNVDDIYQLISSEDIIDKAEILTLQSFISKLRLKDLMEAQEEYVDMFDRVRSLSLHLFEHVHGESRDRGQAMVDLAERYKEQGFAVTASELPDYLPVFLEYLSSLPKEQAQEELAEISHILKGLGKRLAERDSIYHLALNILIKLSGAVPEFVEPREITPKTFEQIDKEWEEKPIEFLGAETPVTNGCGGCGGGSCGGSSQKVENVI